MRENDDRIDDESGDNIESHFYYNETLDEEGENLCGRANESLNYKSYCHNNTDYHDDSSKHDDQEDDHRDSNDDDDNGDSSNDVAHDDKCDFPDNIDEINCDGDSKDDK